MNDLNQNVVVKYEFQPQLWLDSVLGSSLTTSNTIRLTVYHLPTTENDQIIHCSIQAHQDQQPHVITHHEEAEL